MFLSLKFRHIVFPGQQQRRGTIVDLARNTQRVFPLLPSVAVPPAALPTHPGETDEFIRWLFRESGIDASYYRRDTVQRRLPACLRALRARSVSHARQMIEATPSLRTTAVSAVLIGVTSFFRDPPVFEALQNHVIPYLTESSKRLRIWSAGCADGSELYSVALLLAEAGLLTTSYLLGTDCRPDAIEAARVGGYDPDQVRHVPPPLLRYFTARDNRFQISTGIRHGVRWHVADILSPVDHGAWDLIFCRNTAIYLRAAAAAALMERFGSMLRPGGVLVLGKAERPADGVRFTAIGPCLYRRCRG